MNEKETFEKMSAFQRRLNFHQKILVLEMHVSFGFVLEEEQPAPKRWWFRCDHLLFLQN